MRCEFIGFVRGIDWKKKEISVYLMGKNEPMKVDIFTGMRKFKHMGGVFQQKLLEIISKHKGKVIMQGYCYNGNTMIAEKINFKECDELVNTFVDFTKDQLRDLGIKV